MQNESTGRTEKWSLPLPFLTTHPLTDIGLLFLLLPLWWALELDQFIWPSLVLFLFLKTLTYSAKQKRSLRLPLVINPMLFFLVIHGVSGIFIVEKDRYLLFLY